MSVLSDDNSPFTHYEALERRCRGIIRHLVLSVAAGAAAGVIGTLIHLSGIRQVELAYDPYAYFALAVLVGRTAAGLGWAALSATLAALAPLIPALAGIGLAGHARDALGGDPDSLNILLLVLVGFGLVGYRGAARGRRRPGGPRPARRHPGLPALARARGDAAAARPRAGAAAHAVVPAARARRGGADRRRLSARARPRRVSPPHRADRPARRAMTDR